MFSFLNLNNFPKTRTAFLNIGLPALALLVGYALVRYSSEIYQHFKPQYIHGDYSLHYGSSRRPVLYISSTCPYCKLAQEFLTQRGVSFDLRIVDKNDAADKMYKLLTTNTVPVLLYQDKMVLGYRTETYAEILSLTEGIN